MVVKFHMLLQYELYGGSSSKTKQKSVSCEDLEKQMRTSMWLCRYFGYRIDSQEENR